MDKFSFTYDKNKEFLQIEVSNEINLSDLLYLPNKLENYLSLFSEDITVLYDFRQAKADFKPSDIKGFKEPLTSMIEKFNSVKVAQLVTSPLETALAVIFKKKMDHLPNLKYEVFCGKNEALKWLHCN